MDYYEEEEDQIKNVISHKKNEFRVEIRRKKMQQELQSKRLKTIHQLYSKLFENDSHQVSETNQNQEQYFEENNQNSQNQDIQNNFHSAQSINQVPNILEIPKELNKAMEQLQDSHKMKDILQCQDIMKQLNQWVRYYVYKDVIVETTSVLNLMIKYNLHVFCSVYTSMKYLQYEDIQCYSYCILAQLSSIISKQSLDEMVDKHIFNHFIETLQHSKSSKIIDNLFHTMGNFAGDSTFGPFFCSEMVDRDITVAVLNVIEQSEEKEIEGFLDSFLFFIWNFIRYIPEIQRVEIYQFTPLMLLLLKIVNTDSRKKYVINCLQNLILYEPSNISECTEEDYNALAWLIYNNPKLIASSLNLINTIVGECLDESMEKLVDNGILISLVKVIESSQEQYRFKSAFIISNISSIPEQKIQDKILDQKIYSPLMKSLMDDSSFRVKKELAFFLANLVSSATADTIIHLIEKKSVLHFIEMLFSKFNSDVDLMNVVITGFCSLFKQITLFANDQQFRKCMKEIQELGLFNIIEQFTSHKNQEISEKAEGLYSQLQQHSLISEKKSFENSSSKSKNTPVPFYNSRNQIAEFKNQINPNFFKQSIENNSQQNNFQNNIDQNQQHMQFSNNNFQMGYMEQQNSIYKNQMKEE